MQTPPDDLSEDVLASVLVRDWGLACASMTYRPLGFGSHHWQIVDADGTRWFGTVDELETKRHSADESLDTAFDRLRAALGAARALHDSGATFALAPVPTRDGEPVVRNEASPAVWASVSARSADTAPAQANSSWRCCSGVGSRREGEGTMSALS